MPPVFGVSVHMIGTGSKGQPSFVGGRPPESVIALLDFFGRQIARSRSSSTVFIGVSNRLLRMYITEVNLLQLFVLNAPISVLALLCSQRLLCCIFCPVVTDLHEKHEAFLTIKPLHATIM